MERPGCPALTAAAQPAPQQPAERELQPGRGAGGSVTSRWISCNPAPHSWAASAAPRPRSPPRSRSTPPAPGRARPTAAASPSPATGAASSAVAAAEAAVAAAAAWFPASLPLLRLRRWSAGSPASGPARDPASHWPPGLRAVHWAPPRGRAARVSGPPSCHLGARLAVYITLVRSRPPPLHLMSQRGLEWGSGLLFQAPRVWRLPAVPPPHLALILTGVCRGGSDGQQRPRSSRPSPPRATRPPGTALARLLSPARGCIPRLSCLGSVPGGSPRGDSRPNPTIASDPPPFQSPHLLSLIVAKHPATGIVIPNLPMRRPGGP